MNNSKRSVKRGSFAFFFARGLISIGKEEIEKMIEEDGKADTTCHFCNKKYHFFILDLEKILNKLQDLN